MAETDGPPEEKASLSVTKGFSLKESTIDTLDEYYNKHRDIYRSRSHVVEVAILKFLRRSPDDEGQHDSNVH